jgi:anti-sigma factor RsiW
MAVTHVTELFSDAYDGLLDDDARSRFDRHLARCAPCAAGFAALSVSIDAVRALPATRMPVPVRLPSTPPVAAREGVLAALHERLRVGPGRVVIALGGVTAAAAAAIVVVALAMHHGGAGTGTVASGPLADAAGGGSVSSSSSAFGAAPGTAAPQPGAVLAPQTTGAPLRAESLAAFPYSVVVPVPGHPDEELVLATQSGRVTAGQQVLVLARVQPRATGAAALPGATLPDVRLLTGVGVAGSGNASPAAPAQSSGLPAAIAQAPSASMGGTAGDGQPLLAVSLPASLQSGQIIELVALLPDAHGHPQVVGVLSLTVS